MKQQRTESRAGNRRLASLKNCTKNITNEV